MIVDCHARSSLAMTTIGTPYSSLPNSSLFIPFPVPTDV